MKRRRQVGPPVVAVGLVLTVAMGGCADSRAEIGGTSTGGPVLRTPTQGRFYPTAGVVGTLHLDDGCLSLTERGSRAIPVWPPSTTWDEERKSVGMTSDGYSVTYRVGSRIGDAGGGYYTLPSQAPDLVGERVWAQAVACARRVHAHELVLVAPAST